MYTIREAAHRSGVSIPLLRAWERRYGIVRPERTASGYRLYDDAALERLRTMRRLVSDGWTPSTAAAAILSGTAIELPDEAPTGATRGTTPDATLDGTPATAADRGATADHIERFVDAAIDFDAVRLEGVLDAMFAVGTFETVADAYLLPALVAIGNAWADGRLGVGGEHAASHAVLRRLGAAFQAAGRPGPADGAVLVGMPPTVRHELGALAFATAARRAGVPVIYLGPDLPVDEWVATAERTRARAAVIGVVTELDIDPAIEVAAALRATQPALAILFGGRAADRAAERARLALELRSRSGAAVGSGLHGPDDSPIALPERLLPAVEALRTAIATDR